MSTYLDKELFKQQIRSKCQAGDIIMAKIGAQCGTCAIVPDNHPISIIAGNCLKITTDAQICNNKYLLYYLHSLYEINGLAQIKSITAQPAISLKNLKSLEILLPPLSEQKRIIDIFSSIDYSFQKNQEKFAQLHTIKKALMSDLLRGKIRVKL